MRERDIENDNIGECLEAGSTGEKDQKKYQKTQTRTHCPSVRSLSRLSSLPTRHDAAAASPPSVGDLSPRARAGADPTRRPAARARPAERREHGPAPRRSWSRARRVSALFCFGQIERCFPSSEISPRRSWQQASEISPQRAAALPGRGPGWGWVGRGVPHCAGARRSRARCGVRRCGPSVRTVQLDATGGGGGGAKKMNQG